jgi:hypothetical protein
MFKEAATSMDRTSSQTVSARVFRARVSTGPATVIATTVNMDIISTALASAVTAMLVAHAARRCDCSKKKSNQIKSKLILRSLHTQMCMINLDVNHFGENSWLMGDTFMRKVYTAHDYEAKMMGCVEFVDRV